MTVKPPGGGRPLLLTALVGLALALPAVALAELLPVRGTAESDRFVVEYKASDTVQVTLDGEVVLARQVASGDFLAISAGPGADEVTVGDVGRFERGLRTGVRLGGGDDVLSVNVIVDFAGNSFRYEGGPGDDRLTVSDASPTRLSGGDGDDRISGRGRGRDAYDGALGKDQIVAAGRQRDAVRGGSGDDEIATRGGGRDSVNCGAGTDTVRADRRDRVAGNCENVVRAPAGGDDVPPPPPPI